MSDLRPVLAALLLLAAPGCCWSVPRTDACVVGDGCTLQDSSIDYCDETGLEVVHHCRGWLHEGESCADLGFTIGCADGRWVAPGSTCG